MNRPLNAFQTVRPRGNATMPRAVPEAHTSPRGPALRSLVLDAKGRRCIPLAPRSNGEFSIESGTVAQASVNKRQALVKGGI